MLSGPFLKYAAQEGERVKAQYELDGMRDRARVVGRCSSTDVCMPLGRCHLQAQAGFLCVHLKCLHPQLHQGLFLKLQDP